jgi:hypothetical protein
MRIYAQAFSEKGASRKLADLLDAEARAEAAIRRIENVAKGACVRVLGGWLGWVGWLVEWLGGLVGCFVG